MEEDLLPEICHYCQAEQVAGYNFCSGCGRRNSSIVKTKSREEGAFNWNLKYLAIYSFLSILLLLINTLTEDTLEVLLFSTFFFAFMDVVFASIQPAAWSLFKVNIKKIVPLLTIVPICIVSGVVITYSTDHLNLLLFEEAYSTIYLFYELEHPLLYAIIVMAVFPAVFEELAFRGFVFNSLKAIGGKRSAIWGSAFLFGLVHLSLLSIVWIIPFGLLLAYYRNKHSTIVYGIIGHFTHNTTVVLLEYYEWMNYWG